MRLTSSLLRRIISEEKGNFDKELQLRKAVRQQLRMVLEDSQTPVGKPKAGAATSDAEGTLDVKKLADTLGVDPGKLKTAITNLRSNKRNSTDDKVFGDMVAKLIDADSESTVKAMTVLKKVSSSSED